MNKIKINTIENELYYNGKVVVTYSIEYPEIVFSENIEKMELFNYENRKEVKDLIEYIEDVLYEKAKKENNKIEYIREYNILSF